MKLLVIDDDVEIQNIVIQQGVELGMTVIPFVPKYKEWNDMRSQLSELCQTEQFNFALLDFELWGGLKGYYFAETLLKNGVKFVAFSSSYERNSMLVKVGAIDSIQKNYNSRGFDLQSFSNKLKELYEKVVLDSSAE